MDCQMPILDGYQACQQIRNAIRQQNLVQPYIVACSGDVADDHLSKAWNHQFDEIIPKPVSVENLKAVLK